MSELETVTAVLAENAQRDPQTIAEDTRLDSLGLASIDVLEVIFQLETRLGITFPDGAADDLSGKSVGDLAALVKAIRNGTWAKTSS